jgi:hypothetical protein
MTWRFVRRKHVEPVRNIQHDWGVAGEANDQACYGALTMKPQQDRMCLSFQTFSIDKGDEGKNNTLERA